jgi:hypothetical protein
MTHQHNYTHQIYMQYNDIPYNDTEKGGQTGMIPIISLHLSLFADFKIDRL